MKKKTTNKKLSGGKKQVGYPKPGYPTISVIDIYKAEVLFSWLIERVESGEDFILIRDGVPIVRVIPYKK